MKKIVLIATFILSLSLAFGHEFWLEPSQYFARVGDQIWAQVYH